ncbi:MAG: hypothetical protein D6812_17740 [Deltaproteobacteria bacterium]|nr:MAG: hypothetical protein D6812_17740 [Deltaproteobacteria bacterium]
MAGTINNPEEALRAIMNALAEDAANLSDEDAIAEIRAEGRDPARAAERVRAILRKACTNERQRPLRAAAEEYRRRVKEMRNRRYTLPESPEERRRLLELVMLRRPAMKSAFLTAQYRDFECLPDDDIESILKQLQELGVLEDISGDPDPER